MHAGSKYEVWDTQNDNRGYWVIRDDGMCWEFSTNDASPTPLGHIYIPKGERRKHWKNLSYSELPTRMRWWLDQLEKRNKYR